MFAEYENKQPIAYKILNKSIKNNEYNHAYLIETNGYDDAFNFTISFVKEILISNKEDKEIISKMIDDNNYTELRIINPDGSWIKKEQLIDLQEEFSKKSLVGSNKVYIINHADRLNDVSSNSILKFLEEPQEGIIAILITDNRYRLIDTIVSRCQLISLNGQVDINNSMNLLEKIGQKITRTKEGYDLFIQDDTNNERLNSISDFIKYYENNGKKVIFYINKYWNIHFINKDMYNFGLTALLLFYQDALNIKLNRNLEYFNDELVKKVSEKNTVDKLVIKITAINSAIEKLDNNANLNLLMDKLIIEMEA